MVARMYRYDVTNLVISNIPPYFENCPLWWAIEFLWSQIGFIHVVVRSKNSADSSGASHDYVENIVCLVNIA